MVRDTQAFLDRVADIRTAKEFVQDRQVLKVALGAFGLDGDIDNRFFVRKVLEDGTMAEDALANKLADKRYREFSAAFGFGPGAVRQTASVDRMEAIVGQYRTQSFEVSVGENDETMRIALYAQRRLSEIAGDGNSESTRWYAVLGLPPLRKLFETGLGLPAAFSQLDLDRQVETLREKLQRATGAAEIGQFTDPAKLGRLTDLFLARSQVQDFGSSLSPAANALALLQR